MTPSSSAAVRMLMDEVKGVKQASARENDPRKDPGGYNGPSDHPSAKDKTLDDGLIDLHTGARAAENEADIKRTIPGDHADSAGTGKPEGGEGTPNQDKAQLGIGLHQSSTGGDPKVEDEYKDHHSDPGTTSPARADRGEKYSADISKLRALPFDKLAAETAGLGNEILADLVARSKAAGTQSPAPAQAPASNGAISPEKQAHVHALAAEWAKEASITADLVIQHLDACMKRAGMPPEEEGGEGPPPGAEGPPPGAEGPPPGAGGPPPGAGGMPPGLAGAIEGAPGMDAPPAEGGPPASPHEAVHELASALMEMGIDPAELAAVAQQMQAGAAGGAPGGMPGPDEAKMADARELYKLAHVVTTYRKSGKFRFTPAVTKRARALRDEMGGVISEILSHGA